jgi:hypothetical protein
MSLESKRGRAITVTWYGLPVSLSHVARTEHVAYDTFRRAYHHFQNVGAALNVAKKAKRRGRGRPRKATLSESTKKA